MEIENFDLETARQKDGVVDKTELMNYLSRCVFADEDGSTVHIHQNHTHRSMALTDFKNGVLSRLSKQAKELWIKDSKIFKTIIDPKKPKIEVGTLNLFKGYKHEYIPYEQIPMETKAKVQIVLDYVKEVLANGSPKDYEYLIKWYAVVAQGGKNDTLLYFRGPEGCGKTTLPRFCMKHVFGYNISTKATVEPLRSRFNSILMGKMLVSFEELPTFSVHEWRAVSGTLKDMVTGDRMTYEEKNIKSAELDNLNNYVICTNVEALQHSEGRRYYIADSATHRINDHSYWDKVYACIDDDVGKAFFSYLKEVDVKKFSGQKCMPLTKGKLDAQADHISTELLFIKDNYVLPK